MSEFCFALPVHVTFDLSLSHPTSFLTFPILSPIALEGSEWLTVTQMMTRVKTTIFQHWSVLCQLIDIIALFFSPFV